MKPAPFAYAAPRSVEEAVALLAAENGEAKLLAGGQSLVPMLNFRLLEPALLIDINGVVGLDGIAETPDGLRIGALVRHRALETSPLVAARFPIIPAAMAEVAHLAIRNRGTIGGSLAHADPAAELPLLALLLEARLLAVSVRGRRTLAARDFFAAALTTALEPDELVAEIALPGLPERHGWGFAEFARRAGDFALAAVGAIVALEAGRCRVARIALGGVGPTPLRADAAEALLRGASPDEAAIAAAARAAAESAQPASDLHASAEYRRHLVEVLARRALGDAVARAGEAKG
jgi:aerobic carbon-monoxide dehydrogenase medium subunit